MTTWICVTCGVEHADAPAPPTTCAICSDERQWVPRSGQSWTTHEELRGTRSWSLSELEPDLAVLTVEPELAIGQQTYVVRTSAGVVVWEPSGYLEPAMLEAVLALGPVVAVTASHPHLVGAAVSWSRATGAPFLVAEADLAWVRRPDPLVTTWSGTLEVAPGVTLVQTGGHFAGSAVLHLADHAEGRGELLVGDTLMVTPARTLSFMRSFPNYLPLPERLVRGIVAALEPLAYDRVRGAFPGRVVEHDAPAVLARSAERYVAWLRDEVHDADGPVPA